jgi:two-component system response regulator PilR (NtrC family)
MSNPAVLIIDDEPDIRELLSITLSRMNLDCASATNVREAQELLGRRRFDLCLTDMNLPDGNGLSLVEWMQEHAPRVPVAVITAHGNVESAVRALKLGAFDFVSKPLDLAGLRKLVSAAIKVSAQDQRPPDGQEPQATTDEELFSPRLLGRSQAMRHLRELIAKVARSQAPVHICGESGTGKELVARLIHESGPRRDSPFVPVNCGAIPSELMESEFFGHKRGSFTGAVADKAGMIRAADGGTLFLDEMADLPLHMQVKLLRVIQEKSVRPVGETREAPVDVRILSATHKNLAALVAEGAFREDLFYRVNVIEIRVPALRERPEDIPELTASIVRRLAERLQTAPPELAPEALERLKDYAFPGNVRELENILERALALCSGGLMTPQDLQLRQTPATAAARATGSGGGPLGDQLEDIERDAILKALEQTRYNKTAAAKMLGMSFRALRYRIRKLGIE